MTMEKVQFQERIEDGVRKLYVVSAWPDQIKMIKSLTSDSFYFDGDILYITCANGRAKYRENGSCDEVWCGDLISTAGENSTADKVTLNER